MAWVLLKIYDESPYEHCVENQAHAAMLLAAQKRADTAIDINNLIQQQEVAIANPMDMPAATIIGNCSVDAKDRPKLVAIAEQVEAGFQAARYALASGVAADIFAAADLIASFDGSLVCSPERTIEATTTNKIGPHRMFSSNNIKGLDLAFVAAHRTELAAAVRAKGHEAEKEWSRCIELLKTVPEGLRLASVQEVQQAAAAAFIANAERVIDAAEATMREPDAEAGAAAKEEYLEALAVLLAVQQAIETQSLKVSPEHLASVEARTAVGKEFYRNAEPDPTVAAVLASLE